MQTKYGKRYFMYQLDIVFIVIDKYIVDEINRSINNNLKEE